MDPSYNMRRRHSTHMHELERLQSGTVSDFAQGNLHGENTSPSNGSHEARNHVRFSLDDSQRNASRHKKDDDVDVQPRNGRSSRLPTLAVDTQIAANHSSHGPRTAPVESSMRITSPTSPSSARSRARGISLRSSLFSRNIDRDLAGSGSVVAMTPLSSNADASTSSKKATGATVQVTPIADTRRSSPGEAISRLRSHRAAQHSKHSSALPNYQRWFQKRTRSYLPTAKVAEICEKLRKTILRLHDLPPSKNNRSIPLDPFQKAALIDDRTSRPYIGNVIRSSKYTPYNFVPRQLFAQFSKLANFYFLCVSILQMIPGLSTTGTYTTIVPLLFFVTISMAKEGYEDWRRHKLDRLENNREIKVLHAYKPVKSFGENGDSAYELLGGPVHWATVKWHTLQVGDIVKLRRNEPVPADIVLISSTGADDIAYIETMALDGETNLKNKQPPAILIPAFTSDNDIARGGANFVVEDPNLDLYNFEGRVTIQGQTAPLTNNEIIYRGSVLRNTPEAVGVVIYSGEECKIRMNANKNPRIKAPSLQSIVNKIIAVIVVFVILLAVFNTLAYGRWHHNHSVHRWYLSKGNLGIGQILVSFIIMFNTMIPLSLYVSLEIIKVSQTLLLNDVDMYDDESDTPFEARTSTINEELGQVSYIFSDKTGTLTENVMRFRKISVAGTAWSHEDELEASNQKETLLHKKRKPKSQGKKPWSATRTSLSKPRKSTASASSEALLNVERPITMESSQGHSSLRDETLAQMSTTEMLQYIQTKPDALFAGKARMMLLAMAICHTCLPERIGDGDEDIAYQASSPDELALVKAAQELGFIAFNRTAAMLTLKSYPNGRDADPHLEEYTILDVVEFSSKRKRMSVVVRFPDGRIAVICKGADIMVMKRLRLANFARQKLAEIEQRVSERKSMEAEEVIRRKSSQLRRSGSLMDHLGSPVQPSRHSFSRPSISRLEPIRDEVDTWLKEREHDVTKSPVDYAHYTPRPSAQLGRSSFGGSLHRPKSHVSVNDDDDFLVDESMVIDDAVVIERCLQHVNDFATEGLRTLLYGHRFLSDEEYAQWKEVYLEATTSLKDRQVMIEQAGELIEQKLELTGATAIEDKLQKGVPETIDRLRRANIKMWMLTGDKRETAINIGQSCRLIKDYSTLTVLDWDAGDVEQTIAAAMLDIYDNQIAHSVVVVDGQTLAAIEAASQDDGDSLMSLFTDLAVLADSVICCRASPSQKAGLVGAIRRRVSKSVTLAIGDGANDIAMIQEAHVGIGITGKEGLQAARTSDYAIAQFRFLTKLLLVHGRWNYIRTSKYTVATFWKEMLFYLTQAIYQRSTGFSGTSLYESWSLSMFNTLFTSLPVIFLGIFEQDLRASTLIAVPELYTKGQRRAGFNLRVYIGWMFTAATEAIVIYHVVIGLYGMAPLLIYGDLFAIGDLCFTACIIVINTKLQIIEQRYKSVMTALAYVLSVGGWFLWNILFSVIYGKNNEYDVRHGFLDRFGRYALWWLTLIIAVASCLLFEVGLRALKCTFFPTDVEIFQTLEQDLAIRKRFEEASAEWLQAGWHRGTKKSSLELRREAEQQSRREDEVQALLDRPRVMEEGHSGSLPLAAGVMQRPTFERVHTEEQRVTVEDGSSGKGTDIREMLSRRFGSVRADTLK